MPQDVGLRQRSVPSLIQSGVGLPPADGVEPFGLFIQVLGKFLLAHSVLASLESPFESHIERPFTLMQAATADRKSRSSDLKLELRSQVRYVESSATVIVRFGRISLVASSA